MGDAISFHDIEHTKHVVRAAEEIGEKEGLTKEELETVKIAAWLHDVGYTKSLEAHEESSVQLARFFLFQHGMDSARINTVIGCIRATKMPQEPKNKLEAVLCDADLYHLSQEYFDQISDLLRKEFSEIQEIEIPERQWYLQNIDFLQNHNYFTEYGKQELQPLKEKNLEKLIKRMNTLREDEAYVHSLEKEQDRLEQILRDSKEKQPGRGIETMFRVTAQNHMKLSYMADNKANILISVNAIILSVVVTILIRKFEDTPYLFLPTLILVLSCLTAIVFAILSTRPSVNKGEFNRSDIEKRNTNLLFFGNFFSVKLEDYLWGMKEMMKSGDYLYTSMIRDIYFIGQVLGKKYKLLRFSYICFMIGIVISVISYVLSAYFHALGYL